MNTDTFTTWLRAKKYAPRTVANSLADLATLVRKLDDAAPLRPSLKRVVGRLEAFSEETGDDEARRLAARARERFSAEKPSRFGGRRIRTHATKQIDDESWKKLVTTLEKTGGLAARVLEVMVETALRVNDALQIRPLAVKRALELGAPLTVATKGGKQRRIDLRAADAMWKRLLAEVGGWDYPAETTLAQLVSPGAEHTTGGSFGPYKKVWRTLAAVCKAAGVTERVWTHRFRHTVLANVYAETSDILLVRDLADHDDLKTTQIYTGKTKPERIAEALARVSVKTRRPT